jgi:hypothetical protein
VLTIHRSRSARHLDYTYSLRFQTSLAIAPEFVTNAASDLANAASTINAVNAAAAANTSDVVAAGAD